MRRRRIAVILVIALCLSIVSILVLRPGMEIVPPPRHAGGTLPEPASSCVSMPVWVSRAELEALIDKDLRPPGDNDAAHGEVGLDWEVEPIALAPVDGGLKATTTVRGQVVARKVVTVTVEGSAKVGVAVAPQITSEWRLEPHASGILEITRARIKALGLDISFDGKAERALRPLVGQMTRSFNRLVAALPLRGLMQLVWMLAQAPQQLRRELPAVWLQLRPEAVQIGPMVLGDDRLEFQLGLRCNPLLGIGNVPPAPARSKLPPPEPPGKPGFSLSVPIRLRYAQLASDILARVSPKVYPIGKHGSFRITDLMIYPSDDRLVVGAHIDAALPGRILDTRGWVYIWGHPRCEAHPVEVRIADLDFHEETRSYLAHLADSALHDALVSEVGGQLSKQIAKAVDDARTRAKAAIANRQLAKGIVLDGRITDLAIAGIALEQDDLAIAVTCTGEASIRCELPHAPTPDAMDVLFP